MWSLLFSLPTSQKNWINPFSQRSLFGDHTADKAANYLVKQRDIQEVFELNNIFLFSLEIIGVLWPVLCLSNWKFVKILIFTTTQCVAFSSGVIWLWFSNLKSILQKMLSSKLLLFPRQLGWRNNIMKMIEIYKKPELKWPKQNDRNETNLTT